ncbi:MAG TPA: Tol-Pal system beta propeller repeat protein TolB [Methylomirabilota bacterium]|nr:Tol-Pal system beta propeller repeat protein TolB [Methylomirabilota bacterium]
MRPPRSLLILVGAVLVVALVGALSSPPPARSQQGVDVMLNVFGTGAKKLNIVVPELVLAGGGDPQGLAKRVPEVTGNDLRFSALFSVVDQVAAPTSLDAAGLRAYWEQFPGAHAGLLGLLRARGDRVEVEMRLYDLTDQSQRIIATRKLEMPTAQFRRLAHKVADEVVFQYTGERGVADTKIAFVSTVTGTKELYVTDYDGANVARLTSNRSINLSPAWSPDSFSIAFTSYMGIGYPYVYRVFPFGPGRPAQLLAGHYGLNSSPAWSPDGQSLALTLTKDGNPEIYVLTVATGALRRLTNHPGIDTEPTWSPTGREIAFVSERAGGAQIFVMDEFGANLRRLTNGGFNTQPRWSPKGDTIAYTARQGGHNIWAAAPDGSNPRALTAGPGNNESASWAPNGRHLVFQSSRGGSFQLYTMLADGSEQQPLTRGAGEATSGAWSNRLP